MFWAFGGMIIAIGGNMGIINNVNNKKYSSYKIWNLCWIVLTYTLAVFGLKLMANISGDRYRDWVSGSALIGILVSFVSIILVVKQNKYFKQIIYPLIFFKGEKSNKYKKSVMRYRNSVYIGQFIQAIIILLFEYWFLLVYIYPDSVILYALPKVSFVTIITYLVIFFAVDSQLDNIYWEYFETDFTKYERDQFKKKKSWSDKISKNKSLIVLIFLFFFFIIFPLLVQMHFGWPYRLANFLTQGSHSDWLQFWGSYLGVIPSGLIVYYVARIQINQQRENDKELIFKPARPLFKILYSNKIKYEDISEFRTFLPEENQQEGTFDIEYRNETVIINNLSDNSLLGIKIFVLYKNNTYDIYNINKLGRENGIILSEMKSHVDKIVIYFNTRLRELIRLTFIQKEDDVLEYCREDKFIENKDKNFPTINTLYTEYDKKYTLNNFVQSFKEK